MEQVDGTANNKRVTGRTRQMVIALDRAILAFARRWLLWINLFVFVYVGLPFLAPPLMNAGLTGPATVIYTLYGGVCHQLGHRSWYLFGERSAYPRDIFEQYAGVDPDDFWASRAFIGNRQVGFKVAYCQRDVAIYAGILLGGLILSVPSVAGRIKPLHWLVYGLIGVAPIALDGFSQLFSQSPYNALPPFNLLPFRESTPLLRTVTGGLFGLANVWLAYPYVARSMHDIRAELEARLARVDAGK